MSEQDIGGLPPIDGRKQEIIKVFQEMQIEVEEEGKNKVINFNLQEIEEILSFEHLLSYKSETLREIIPERFKQNLINFHITAEEWKRAALKQPSLFTQSPETINRNIEEAASLLGLEKKIYT